MGRESCQFRARWRNRSQSWVEIKICLRENLNLDFLFKNFTQEPETVPCLSSAVLWQQPSEQNVSTTASVCECEIRWKLLFGWYFSITRFRSTERAIGGKPIAAAASPVPWRCERDLPLNFDTFGNRSSAEISAFSGKLGSSFKVQFDALWKVNCF